MSRSTLRVVLCWLFMAFAGTLAACERPAPPPVATEDGPRIVSLSPAITRTLVDLGLRSRIVGRSAFCESVDADVPAIGTLTDIDYERLLRVRPTHVLVQPPAAGVEPRLAELAATEGWTLASWHLDGIDDIRRVVQAIPALLEGEPDVAARAADLDAQLAATLAPAPDRDRWSGEVLAVCYVEPVTVFGDGTYLDDLLRAAGATNAAKAQGWVELSLEDVQRMNPPAILLVRAAPAAGAEPPDLGPLGALDVEAVRAGRIAALDHPDVLLPSTAVIGVAKALDLSLRELAGAQE